MVMMKMLIMINVILVFRNFIWINNIYNILSSLRITVT
jgi:hypothetical protein